MLGSTPSVVIFCFTFPSGMPICRHAGVPTQSPSHARTHTHTRAHAHAKHIHASTQVHTKHTQAHAQSTQGALFTCLSYLHANTFTHGGTQQGRPSHPCVREPRPRRAYTINGWLDDPSSYVEHAEVLLERRVVLALQNCRRRVHDLQHLSLIHI